MKSTARLLSLIPEVEKAFELPRTDHRNGGETIGGVITRDHVLRYLYVNIYRKSELFEIIQSRMEWQNILSVGVAYGFLPILIKEQLARNVTGVDLPENLDVYCDLLKVRSIPIIGGELGSEDNWPILPGSYDLIILGEVLEHLRVSPYRAIRQIYASLRPGGSLLLTTPNVASLSTIGRLISGRNIFEPFQDADFNNPTDSWIHIREYTLEEVRSLLQHCGFLVELSYLSHCWDRYNPYLHKFIGSSRRAKLRSHLRSLITMHIPKFRQDMFFLATKRANAPS